jgi:hypothetical protein
MVIGTFICATNSGLIAFIPEGSWLLFAIPSVLRRCRPDRGSDALANRRRRIDPDPPPHGRDEQTHRWRGVDSNLYGAFPVKWWFWFVGGSLFGAGKPFFVL